MMHIIVSTWTVCTMACISGFPFPDGLNWLKSSSLIKAAALATVSKQYISWAVWLDWLTVAGSRLTELRNTTLMIQIIQACFGVSNSMYLCCSKQNEQLLYNFYRKFMNSEICWPRWPTNFLLNSSDLKQGLFLWLLRVTELKVEMVQYSSK